MLILLIGWRSIDFIRIIICFLRPIIMIIVCNITVVMIYCLTCVASNRYRELFDCPIPFVGFRYLAAYISRSSLKSRLESSLKFLSIKSCWKTLERHRNSRELIMWWWERVQFFFFISFVCMTSPRSTLFSRNYFGKTYKGAKCHVYSKSFQFNERETRWEDQLHLFQE